MTSGRGHVLVAGTAVIILALIASTVSVLTRSDADSPQSVPHIVNLPAGRFQGSVKTDYNGSTVVRYAGIPYAQPPVGDLRFRPPLPLRSNGTSDSSSVFDATKMRKSCWSITKKTPSPFYSEDCLYLNVYLPYTGSVQNLTKRFPVVVWIHGGGFVAGSVFPEPYRLVSQGQVIVVTFNYRLGALGFLTTQDDLLPANNGLWDQVLALDWVKANIQAFGGNPDSITLFGESAGGVSAALHVLSPESSHLFHRVLLQSGAATSMLRRNPKAIARQFGNASGCGDVVSAGFADCVRNLSIETILVSQKSANYEIPEAGKQTDFIWLPTVDGTLVPDEPGKLLSNGSYLEEILAYEKDYLFGLNNNDGSLAIENFLHPLSTNRTFQFTFLESFTSHLLSLTHDLPTGALTNVTDTVLAFYLGSQAVAGRSSHAPKEVVTDIMADAMFFSPVLKMASAVSACYQDVALQACESTIAQTRACRGNTSGRSFVYVFDYCPPRESGDCSLPCMTHGLDVAYQFPRRQFQNDVDGLLSDTFIHFLAEFIKTGTPTINMTSSVSMETWPAYEDNLQSYLAFSPMPTVRQYFHRYRMNLWRSEIPKLLDEYDTES